jgi:hypothetical protein
VSDPLSVHASQLAGLPSQARGREPCLLPFWLFRLADKRMAMIGWVVTDLAGPRSQRDGAIMVRRGHSSLLVVIFDSSDAGKMSMDQPSTPHIESEFVRQDRVPETMLLGGLAVHWSLIDWTATAE